MAIEDRLAFFTADTTPETVATGTAGHIMVMETVNCSNPSGGAATNIVLTIGADGATTRVPIIPVPAGPCTVQFHANQKYRGAETIQASSSASDDVVVVSINGRYVPRSTPA